MKRWIVALSLLAPGPAFALVDMKNANYTNTWIDMEVPGVGYDFKIVRTYNSRSIFNGMFGFGWCSEFETTLEVTPEGNLKVTECGGGISVVYSPREVTKAEIDKTISKIIEGMKKEKAVGRNDAYYASLRTQLYEDDEERSNLAKKFGLSVPVREGTKFFANGKEVEHFTFNKTHYTRNFTSGNSQRFNLNGRLIAQYDKNGNVLKFEYDKDLIREISDNNGRKLTFRYYPNKKVQKISGPNGLVAEYRFEGLEDLAMVKNAWKNVYSYKYDELHNLVRSSWPDKTFIEIRYDKKRDWVIGFTDRDKCVETYKYEFSANDPKNHYWSTVKKVCGKETVADNRFEFWHKQRPDGQYYLHRVLTNVANNVSDIVYHELFGKPVSIRRNSDRSSFEYYPNGLAKTKTTATAKMEFEYDKTVNKVSQVSTSFLDKQGKVSSKRLTQFSYDKKGNLATAVNSDGMKIAMSYDNRGRISSIMDQAKKVVRIQYEDKFGKPAIVTRPGLGTITIAYKPNGEIRNVESKEGPSVAMQVASTFNNLLDIIAPATAELYL